MADGAWTVRRSTYPLRTPWIGVRADDCVTPAGVEVGPYYLLEVPDFVAVLATIGEDVVLVRQYRHGSGATSLELPGGIVGADETDIVAAATRELQEETGYREGRWTYVLPLCVDPARTTNRLHFVRAEDVVAGPANPEPSEDIETLLVPREDAIRLARTGGIVNGGHAAMLLIGLTR